MRNIAPLENISTEKFLREYWQKKPLIIPGALTNAGALLSVEELKKLAAKPNLQSRIVAQGRGKHDWDVTYGPFSANDYSKLPDKKWTLLVQDIDKVLPRVNDLMERFRFVPYWRMDDVMVSYATPGGSVGPHFDNYDVFLLQGKGKRRWHLGKKKMSKDEFVPGLDLKILPKFKPYYTIDLEEGDLLYVPPRLAHYGVALDHCMTFSTGFRAPSHLDLFQGLFEQAAGFVASDKFYEDPGLPMQKNPGEISAKALDQVFKIVRSQMPRSPEVLSRWFGRFVTEPRHQIAAGEFAAKVTTAGLIQKLTDGAILRRNEATKMAFFRHSNTRTALFVNGQSMELKGRLKTLAELLCSQNSFSIEDLATTLKHGASCDFICAEISKGHFYLTDE